MPERQNGSEKALFLGWIVAWERKQEMSKVIPIWRTVAWWEKDTSFAPQQRKLIVRWPLCLIAVINDITFGDKLIALNCFRIRTFLPASERWSPQRAGTGRPSGNIEAMLLTWERVRFSWWMLDFCLWIYNAIYARLVKNLENRCVFILASPRILGEAANTF